MLKQNIIDNLNLYHSNYVRATEATGEFFDGNLLVVENDRLLLDSGMEVREYWVEQLADIEYIGSVTDYHTYKGTGEIDGTYEFDVINGELLEKIEYLEFSCKVTCHLELEKKIIAKDVKIVEALHVLNKEILQEDVFLYTLTDGSRRVGRLTENDNSYCLHYKENKICDIEQRAIADITRCPAVNDYVLVNTADATYKGLVSAVTENGFNLLVDKKLVVILFDRVEEIRYFGRMSMRSIGKSNKQYAMIDKKYGCKMPHYLHNEDDEKYVTDPDSEWIYVAGVNDRGLIAKNVMRNEGAQVTEAAAWEVGVLAYYNTKDSKGFITDTFVSDATMHKVKFWFQNENKNLSDELVRMLENRDKNLIFLVKYAYANEGDKNPSRIELIRTYDRHYIGKVEVNEGSVRAIPYFYLARERYQKQAFVEVQLKNGKSLEGIWEKYGQRITEENGECIRVDGRYDETYGILLKCGQKNEFVACKDIKDVRTVGTITEYDVKHQIARVDKIYTLYKNDFPTEIQELLENDPSGASILNRRVSFVIRNVPEGKQKLNNEIPLWTECKDVEIIEDKKLEVYVTAHKDSVYWVYDKEDYEENAKNGAEKAKAYKIEADLVNPFKDKELDKYDYPAIVTVREENETVEYVGIDSVEKPPVTKKLTGYLTGMSNGKVWIMSVEDYEECRKESNENPLSKEHPLSRIEEAIAGKLYVDAFDYKVKYEWNKDGIILKEKCKNAQGKEVALHKRYYGYLSSNNEKGGEFGSWRITPFNGARKDNKEKYRENLVVCYNCNLNWDKKFKDKAREAFVNPDSIDLKVNYYQVVYTLKKNKGINEGKLAFKAQIIDVEEKALFSRVEETKEAVNLKDRTVELGLEANEATEYSYGIIKAYNAEKDLWIWRDINIKDNSVNVCVSPDRMVLKYAGKLSGMRTNHKNYYVVRYHSQQNEENAEEKVCVEVMLEYPYNRNAKKITGMRVEKDVLHIEFTEERFYANVSLQKPDNATIIAPDYVVGESILYKAKEESQYTHSFFKEKRDNNIVLENNQVIDAQQIEIYRFGVLTGIGKNSKENEDPTGYLNHVLEFSLRKMDAVAVENFKQDMNRGKIKCPYVYTCKEGYVTEVKALTKEMLGNLIWQPAKMLDTKEGKTERTIQIEMEDKEVLPYYWSANTDSALNSFMKNKNEEKPDIYVQQIVYPDWEKNGKVRLVVNIDTDKKYKKVLRNPEGTLDEYTYCLLDLQKRVRQDRHVAYIFLQDFYRKDQILGQIDLIDEKWSALNNDKDQDALLGSIFASEWKETSSVHQFVAHIVALDDQSYDLFKDISGLSAREHLVEKIMQYCSDNLPETIVSKDTGVFEVLEACRELYQGTCKIIKDEFNTFTWKENAICEDIVWMFNKHSENITVLKAIIGQEDAKHLTNLENCCKTVMDNKATGFQSTYTILNHLSKTLQAHPTPFMMEIMPIGAENTSVRLQAILHDVEQRIEKYHSERMKAPDIFCELNEKQITNNQNRMHILVRNGAQEAENYYDAYAIEIEWEIPRLLLGSADKKVRIEKVNSGTYEYFVLDFEEKNLGKTGSYQFRWRVKFNYDTMVQKGEESVSDWQEETFEFVEPIDRSDMYSPYAEAEEGGALKGTTVMNVERTVAKENVRKKIISSRTVTEGKSTEHLKPGSIVLLHGQRECGKTSFYKKTIQEVKKQFGNKVIVVEYEMKKLKTLSGFEFNFKKELLRLLKKQIEGNKELLQLSEALKEENPELQKLINIPILGQDENKDWHNEFKEVFELFRDNKNLADYQIVVAVDEFTRLCAEILEYESVGKSVDDEKPRALLGFIDELKELGVIQIIIGHAAMMSLIEKLDTTNSVKTAWKENLTFFTDPDAEKVIGLASSSEVQEEYPDGYLEHDPYATVLGERAIERLKDLSGCCPSMLMKLCHYMFLYYQEKQVNYLYEEDVWAMIDRYVLQGCPEQGVARFAEDKFDMLTGETGDSSATSSAIKAYLEYVAIKAFRMPGRKWKYSDSEVQELWKQDEQLEKGPNPREIRELLVERKVLEETEDPEGKYVKIVMGVYEKFIQNKKGVK